MSNLTTELDRPTLPYQESGRPQFHFTARQNWLNDPNGLVYYAGEYHLFFQHNPAGIDWGNMTWGHAVSPDLVHWNQIENAIFPDELGTIYSGSVVVDYDNTAGFQTGSEPAMVAMYTAAGGTSSESQGKPFTQCIAYSNDRGRTWQKYRNNPVLPHEVGENRDPKVIWYAPGQFWVMALFLDADYFALYKSFNLKDWNRIQTIRIPGSSECPDFFPMQADDNKEERWVFTSANGRHLIGRFDGQTFDEIEGPYTLDDGPNFYAMQSFSDIPHSDGRRIVMAWMAGGSYPSMPFNQQMSFPTALSLRRTEAGLRLFRSPVGELEDIKTSVLVTGGQTVSPNQDPIHVVTADLLDITTEVECDSTADFVFRIGDDDLRYSGQDNTISFKGRTSQRVSRSSTIKLEILVDRTSVEIFLDDGESSLTFCITPTDPPPVEFFAERGSVTLQHLQSARLRSAWT